MAANKKNTGFTLIEMVIALAIASIAMLALAKSMTQNANLVAEFESRMLASFVASNEMAKLRYSNRTKGLSKGKKSDKVEMGGRDWRYQANISPTDYSGVMKVEISVFSALETTGPPYAGLISAINTAIQESVVQ